MSLNCNNVKDYVTLYKDGVLSQQTTQEIDEHLAECDDCKQFYKEYDKMNVAVISNKEIPEEDAEYAKIAHKIHKKKVTSSFLNIVGAAAIIASTAYLTHLIFSKDSSK